MARIQYLISVDNLKKQGLIHDNVDTKILARCIRIAQDLNIQSSLGTPLYKAMLTRVENNNWNSDYRLLQNDYIIPALVAWVDYHASIFLNVKMTNKNVGRMSDETRTANSDSQQGYFKNRLVDIAEHYNNRLIGFLKDNDDKYPEYKDTTCKYENIDKQKNKGGLNNVII